MIEKFLIFVTIIIIYYHNYDYYCYNVSNNNYICIVLLIKFIFDSKNDYKLLLIITIKIVYNFIV